MEIWDVCDINRNLIPGRTSVRGSGDMKDDEYHIVVFGVVLAGDGRVMVSMRDPNKWLGGFWEFNGGSAISGESSRQAIERELLEETNLDVSGCSGEVIKSAVKEFPGSNWIYDVWIFETEIDEKKLRPQEGEVTQIEVKSIDWVKEQYKNGKFTQITGEFLPEIENYIKKAEQKRKCSV